MLSAMATDGYTAALKLTAPIGDRVKLYAKGGQLWYTLLTRLSDEHKLIHALAELKSASS